MKGDEASHSIDVDAFSKAVNDPMTWLKNMSTKVMGWKQSASSTDVVNEVSTYLSKFDVAQEALEEQWTAA